ncbi:MAG: hypothetical protein JWO35_699, partial [Candidatus Saccharibacteria bacterium]|nr:hypothetical protein [Candidatus Saccharibacteria bacterium]
QSASTATASTKPGFVESQQANVPKLVSIDNNGGQYYNKLHFVVDKQNNPTDATYLVSVSTDNFVSDIRYVQSDGTLTNTISTSQYRTYSGWGSTSGSLMIGLLPSTTYSVRLKATQGQFTESAYGPASSQATAAPSLTFSLVTSASASPPYIVGLGTLIAGSINTTADTVNTSFSTNGTSGGNVYISGKNGGLLSGSTGYKINAVSSDLTSVSEGFGAQNSSISQSSGGPYTVASPYNVSGTNVGIVGAITRSLYSSSLPVSGGSGVLVLKAKSATTDIAASDYQEILTFVAAGNF